MLDFELNPADIKMAIRDFLDKQYGIDVNLKQIDVKNHIQVYVSSTTNKVTLTVPNEI